LVDCAIAPKGWVRDEARRPIESVRLAAWREPNSNLERGCLCFFALVACARGLDRFPH